MVQPLSFKNIRAWRGSQDQAFEEFCFQLRDPAPPESELVKTGAPDGGVEWYVRHRNGVEWGWQVKYSFDIDSLLGLMEESLKAVIKARPSCRRLTFCIPFDLSDRPDAGKRKAARQKFEDRKKIWRGRITGAERVRIELWQGGDLLDRLNGHPNQRGISWFFWNKEVFSPEWCSRRLEVTIKAAGERYTPELHLDLPVAFALEGLASSTQFWDRHRSLCARIEKLVPQVSPARNSGLGVTAELRALAHSLQDWRTFAAAKAEPPKRMAREAILDRTRALVQCVGRAFPEVGKTDKTTRSSQRASERKSSLRYQLRNLEDGLVDLEEFLEGSAAKAAELGALLLTGDAGQGKTHLLCDAGERTIKASRPAAVFLGGQLSGRDVWAGLAKRLGLEEIGSAALIEGMQSAAEASNAAFVIYIDALNESAEPEGWQQELPALMAELQGNPWISVALSVRSSFLSSVLPPDGLSDVAELEHPGFRGRELEATERFFDHFGLAQPRVPLLTPEFSNPLFLKLYCEGLWGLGLQEPPDGEAHITGVFTRYLKWKEGRIVQHLKLDPALRPLLQAVDEFSNAMVKWGSEQIAYEDASQMMAALAPGKTEWPNTLLGQLLSEGILTAEMAWDSESDDYRRVVRFTYQRFADHQAVRVLLAPYESASAFKRAVAPGKPLRQAVREAPIGWIEAMSIQLPERFGVELSDAANWRHRPHKSRAWGRALIQSIVAREPSAVTDRSRELMGLAQRQHPGLREGALDALLSVAPHPKHPLNARLLHSRLMEMSLQHRDLAWSMPTYFAFGDQGPLDRLIRWAARGRHTEAPDEVVALAVIPIAWTFTSPNRRMRDFATKALARLLAPRLRLVPSLLESYRGVDDPYVAERITVVAHGAVLMGGESDPEAAAAIAREARELLLSTDEAAPSAITRDAVRGIWEWCNRAGVVSDDEYEAARPPYGSKPPEKPRTKKQLERAYDRLRRDKRGNYKRSDYASLFSSLFDLGDFGRYVVGSKVRHFSRHPLHRPVPKRRPRTAEALKEKRWNEFEAMLDPEQIEALAASKSIAEAVDELEPDQQQAFHAALNPRESPDPKAEYPSELANRWIFERVLAMGWEPDLFDEWEQTYVREGPSRTGHKPERFGKKYQWIALRELIARLSDNFHMAQEFGGERPAYEGPWQFYGRDIDPTLPPAERASGTRFADTFERDPLDSWWTPPGPTFSADDPLPPDDWASETSDIPSLPSVVERETPDGDRWIVLQAYFNWDEERDAAGDIRSPRHRDMWTHIKSWLVPRENQMALVEFLRPRSLMNNWMPEGVQLTDDAYLGEMPWAESTQEYPDDWQQVEPRQEAPVAGLLAYPTWSQYHWEGGVWDCSIEDSVVAMSPARELIEAGQLVWRPDHREWTDSSGDLVAQYREAAGERHSALLVREMWLAQQLNAKGWSLVVGRLGEKQLFTSGFSPDLIGSWTVINGVASFDGNEWVHHRQRYDRRDPAHQG